MPDWLSYNSQMPFEILLDAPPAGYAMHHASGVEGTAALIAVREFTLL
ncbi:MAG: hypothetical protein JO231_21275 [Acidobacteria bacterium]|nr:hypothetical protein [Acidobacteriota bacterium]